MNFYQISEECDDQKFQNWAQQVDCFKEMQRQPLMSKVDWICTAKSGKKVNCELKGRTSLDWDTIFIEVGKYDYLMQKWEQEKIIPWYINMCDQTVFLFDLRYVKPSRNTLVRIWDKGAQSFKYEYRYELLTSKALKWNNGKRQN